MPSAARSGGNCGKPVITTLWSLCGLRVLTWMGAGAYRLSTIGN